MDKKSGSWILLTLLLLTLVLTSTPERAAAASPWLWDRVLRQDMTKDAMKMPTSLYIDTAKGLYYVVDGGHNRLLSFNRQGELVNIFNAGKALSIPYDMVKVDEKGIWVVEKGKNSLSYINFKEKKVTPHTLTYQGELVYPDRIEADAGILYILNKATGDIISYTQSLSPVNRFFSPGCPRGFVDFKIHQQKIWALDQATKSIRVFDLTGVPLETFELGDDVNVPISLAIGPNNFIYILDRQRRNVAVYDKNGSFKYRFLKRGMARGQLYYPSEIRFDPWGQLCIVDEGNAKVEIFKR